jgi:tuftelin-interacting protein 11
MKKQKTHYDPFSGQGPQVQTPEWEKYSTGIGSKLLQKMGWNAGAGLGKDGSGIVEPIEVKVRPKNQGLSYKGFQERTTQSLQDFDDENEVGFRNKNAQDSQKENKEREEPQELPSYWKKDKQKRPKTTYESESRPTKSQKIIDMRGTSTVVLDSYEGLVSRPVKVPYLPELYHNLQILVDMKQVSIHNNAQSSKNDSQFTQRLIKEEKGLALVLEIEEEKISRIEDVLHLVEKCVNGNLSLDSLFPIIEDLQTLYLPQWQQYDLVSLVFHSVFPQLKKFFDSWEPLTDPLYGIEEVSMWRPYLDPQYAAEKKLEASKQQLHSDKAHMASPLQGLAELDSIKVNFDSRVNPYYKIFEDILFPKFRQALMYNWNTQTEPQKAIRLLSSWIQIMPQQTNKMIIDNVVLVKLKMEVDKWNPTTATVLISDWIHPWLNLIHLDSMFFLWAPILEKLGDALRHWIPTDSTAFIMIQPWRKVLPVTVFDAFLSRSILPKLKMALNNFHINTPKQDYSLWNQIMKWAELFLHETMIALVYNEFFPVWLQTLYSWLISNPKLEEVSGWYVQWKQQFPTPIGSDPNIVSLFNAALQMMQSAMVPNGKVKPPPLYPKISYTIARPTVQEVPQQTRNNMRNEDDVIDVDEDDKKPNNNNNNFDQSNMTFKEIIERLASEYGILFMPTKRSFESKLIYTFGKISVHIDKNLVFCLKQGQWIPIGIDTLLEYGTKGIL